MSHLGIEKLAIGNVQKKILRGVGYGLVASPYAAMLYGPIKSVLNMNKIKEQMIHDKSPIPQIPKDIKLIRTEKDVDDWFDDKRNATWAQQFLAPTAMKTTLKTNSNALSIFPKIPSGQRAILIPDKFKRGLVIRHELAHTRQAKSRKPLLDKYQPISSQLKAGLLFMDPKKTGTYKTERQAWDMAGVPENNPIRQAALKSYEDGLKSLRPVVLSVPIAAIGGVLLKRIAKR